MSVVARPLRVAVVNARGRAFPVRFMLRKRNGRRPDVEVVLEGTRAAHAVLGRILGYRRHRHEGGRDDIRAGRDVQVLVDDDLDIHARLSIRASEATRPERIAPDRNLVADAFAHPVGKTVVIGIHPNAATVGHGPNVPRVRETAELVTTLARTILYFLAEGFHVVVVGDGNWKQGAASPGWRDLAEMFDELGLSYEFHGLEVVAWSPGLALVGTVMFPREVVRSDHPGALYNFARSGFTVR